MKVRVVLGDDHAMLREGLIALLQQEADIAVVGQASHGLELLRMTRQLAPDVVIADISMPMMGGIEVARRIRGELLSSRVLCLSATALHGQVLEALEAGALGFVLKNNGYGELTRAIRHAYRHQVFLSSELMAPVMNACRTGQGSVGDTAGQPLTWREREVTRLFAEGCSTREVAVRLHISAKTVATHRSHVFRKLNIHSVADLTRYAVKEGMTSLG
ncbi:response regulator [Luteibacter sp. CQ10]|uniref:response regulator n=1 Tax=Luteibacter sp. CQ10 TaxID=2805821 RepID=UPI0034A37675